jgi:hypothetical protein
MGDVGTPHAQIDAERSLLGPARWKRLVDLEAEMLLDVWIGAIAKPGDSLLRRRRRVRLALLREARVTRRRDLPAALSRTSAGRDDVDDLFERLRLYSLVEFAWPAAPPEPIHVPVASKPIGAEAGPEPPPGDGPALPLPDPDALPAPNPDGSYTGTPEQLLRLVSLGKIPRNPTPTRRPLW